jgi:hypothetical protein
MVRIKTGALIFSLCLVCMAQQPMSVEKLLKFLRSEIQSKSDSDKVIADYVRKIKLTQRLDERTIEQLQGEGLGPKTTEALKTLAATTGNLPAPPPPAVKPVYKQPDPPSPEEQKRILAEVTDYAQNYTKGLPNFICRQVTRRYVDPTGKEAWHQQDTVLERLSYFEGHENYKVVSVNDRPVDIDHQKLGGAAVSEGEFGSIMAGIFDPKSGTEFGWGRWTTWGGRLTYVFTYRVPQPLSTYRISQYTSASDTDRVSAIAGYHGEVFVDKETPTVRYIQLETEGLPPDFPIKDVHLTLRYNTTKIGDNDYVLPERAELRSRDDRNVLVKNNIEFRMYQKFGADTAIQFDTPEPLPEVKEEPAK